MFGEVLEAMPPADMAGLQLCDCGGFACRPWGAACPRHICFPPLDKLFAQADSGSPLGAHRAAGSPPAEGTSGLLGGRRAQTDLG